MRVTVRGGHNDSSTAVREIERQYDIDRMMAEQDLLLAYRDVISEKTIQQLLELSESRLTQRVEGKRLRKKVFNVLVECLQNVVNHGHQCEGGHPSIMLLGKSGDHYFVRTGNVILNEDIAAFEERVAQVNALGHEKVRDAYNVSLANSGFSEKGGAGLGLLDMYRRSGNPITYALRPLDDRHAFLSISVTITMGKE